MNYILIQSLHNLLNTQTYVDILYFPSLRKYPLIESLYKQIEKFNCHVSAMTTLVTVIKPILQTHAHTIIHTYVQYIYSKV